MVRFYRVLFLIGILIPQCGRAQTMDCEQTIALATEEFNAGHFYNVPSLLNDCLSSFNRDQRQRAFLLLTQTYLFLDDPIGAQRSFLEVLSANPEFVTDPQLHPIDVVYLSKKFTATPKFSWFVGAGSNVSPVRVILERKTTANETKSYILKPGYQLGLGGEYSYNDNIKVRIEANFLQTSYKVQVDSIFRNDNRTFTDRQTWVNIPFYVCYSDNIGKYRPYGYAGYSFSNLFSDKASMTLQKVQGKGEEAESIEVSSPDFDFLTRRNRINQSVIFGAGVKYKIGLDFVFFDVRYSAGLKNVVHPDYVYANPTYNPTLNSWVESSTPVTGYGHVDDYIRLDNLSFTMGFLRPLYKPRELKRARTKSVLRKMKQGK